MIIIVVSVFLLCNITDLIWWIWKTVAGNEPPDFLLCVTVFTEMLHSCVNVMIYASFGKFKSEFYDFFCSPCLRQDSEIATDLPPLKSNLTTKTSLPTAPPEDELVGVQRCTAPSFVENDFTAPPKYEDCINNVPQKSDFH